MRVIWNAIAAALFCVAAGPLLAQEAPTRSLAELSAYLNEIRSAETEFTQFNADGSLSSGRVLIKRPGRMRFEYDPPDSTLVVAGANTVIIVDAGSNTPPETYPLRRTPLSLLLARRIDLEAAEMIVGHVQDGEATVILAQDPEHPEYGTIEMRFEGEPVALREWVITDETGLSTQIVLEDLRAVDQLPNWLFDTARAAPGRD